MPLGCLVESDSDSAVGLAVIPASVPDRGSASRGQRGEGEAPSLGVGHLAERGVAAHGDDPRVLHRQACGGIEPGVDVLSAALAAAEGADTAIVERGDTVLVDVEEFFSDEGVGAGRSDLAVSTPDRRWPGSTAGPQ